jgi:hypothetical protein
MRRHTSAKGFLRVADEKSRTHSHLVRWLKLGAAVENAVGPFRSLGHYWDGGPSIEKLDWLATELLSDLLMSEGFSENMELNGLGRHLETLISEVVALKIELQDHQETGPAT